MGGSYSIMGTIFGQFTQASSYGKAGYLERSPRWNPSETEVDLSGRVFVVSGANSGIGKQTALELAKRKGTVHLLCRNAERGKTAQQEIIDATNNTNVVLHVVDVSVISEVKKFCSDFLATGSPLNCLIHNAGALPTQREETSEGNESTLATQVLTPFLMNALLLDKLKESAPAAQIIFVTSAGMYTQRLNLENLQSTATPFDGTQTYAQMKRAQMILTEQWAERAKAVGVRVNAMHPGWTVTPGLSSLFETKPVYKNFESSFRSVEQGADTLVWLAVNPKFDETRVTGKLFFDREEQKTHVRFSFTDSSAAQRLALWNTCVKACGLPAELEMK